MGCCASRDSKINSSNTSVQDRAISRQLSSLLESVSQNEGSSTNEVLKLLQWNKDQKFDQMFSLILSTRELNQNEMNVLEAHDLPVKTIGSLSISMLISIANDDYTLVFKALVVNLHAIMVILQTKDPNRESLIELLSKFIQPDCQCLREQYLTLNCFHALVPLYSSKHKPTRMQVAQICDFIYKNSPKAQDAFFQNRGEVALVQLIVRDGDDEEALLMLLDFVYDLMKVKYIQDENDKLNTRSVQMISLSNFHDHMLTLNIQHKSVAAMQKVDKIICEFPNPS